MKPGRFFAVVAVAVVCLIGVALAQSGTTISTRSTTASASANDTAAQSMVRLRPGSPPLPMSGHELALAMGLGQAATTTAATGPKPQMVEEVFKNIQVLKGTTVDDFMGTMGLMSAALGFCCNDCHMGAGTDTVKWEEDNAKKRAARRMVTMVQGINKDSFAGRQTVTCWTCHRGRDIPVMTPPLDTVYGEPQVFLDDVLTPAPGVPPVDEILNKYYAAIGGQQRVAGITSVVAKGKSVGFGGFGGGGQVEFYAKAPNQRAMYIHFPDDPDRGDSTRTFNGTAGWIATPLAVLRKYQLTGGELEGARLDAQLTFPGQIKQVLTNLRVGPPVIINDRDYDVVQGNGQKGAIATLYFDRMNGLLGRVVRFTPSAIGKVPTQVDYSDYRDVNGIKVPHKITFSWLDGKDNIEFTEIQLNTPVDNAKFGEPDPLKK